MKQLKIDLKNVGLLPMTPEAIDYSKSILNVIKNLSVNTIKEPSNIYKLPSIYFEIAETVVKTIEPNLS